MAEKAKKVKGEHIVIEGHGRVRVPQEGETWNLTVKRKKKYQSRRI